MDDMNELKKELLNYGMGEGGDEECFGLLCFDYAMIEAFSKEEITNMTKLELRHLQRLADEIYEEVLEERYFNEWQDDI